MPNSPALARSYVLKLDIGVECAGKSFKGAFAVENLQVLAPHGEDAAVEEAERGRRASGASSLRISGTSSPRLSGGGDGGLSSIGLSSSAASTVSAVPVGGSRVSRRGSGRMSAEGEERGDAPPSFEALEDAGMLTLEVETLPEYECVERY